MNENARRCEHTPFNDETQNIASLPRSRNPFRDEYSYDLWQPYLAVVATCFPQATLVLDRFHVVKLLNQDLDAFRRHLRQEAPDEAGYKPLKWLIFKQCYCLTDAEFDTLQAAFAVNAA